MRSKIFLIQGQHQLAKKITLGEYERINMDKLVQILALRDGHAISAYDPQNVSEAAQHQSEVDKFIESLEKEDCQHLLASEYAETVIERGHIKAVEGFSLMTEWVYEMVHALHKNADRTCVRVECGLPQGRWIIIGEKLHKWHEAMEILNPNPFSLG